MSPTRVRFTVPAGFWFLLLALPLPASADTVRIYVTNSAGDNIHVIDPTTQKVVQVIQGIEASHGVTFSPDGKRLYASNEADDTLDAVEQTSAKILEKIHLSGRPNTVAVTRAGGRVV